MSLSRLSDKSLAQARNGAWATAYDRATVTVGVVHLGPGAFHRAHQAPVFDRLLASDPRWGICGVSLRSAAVRQALAPQDGLYTLVELDAAVRARIVGAVKELITARETPGLALERLASPQTRLVTLTVTEKGYCLTPAGDLDLAHPDVAFDLRRPAAPRSAVGWLVEGLRLRRAAGAAAPSVVSCDNLTDNGGKLSRGAIALAAAQGDADLSAWLQDQAPFPNTMVDAITPATDEPLRARVRDLIGLDDAWPVQRERFSQWVIEDRLGSGAPDLASAGVTLVAQVRPFELAKLRLLNGAHSSLAYIGLLAGLQTVAEAMADPALAGFAERLMRIDIAPSLPRTPGLDLDAYVTAILGRFRNPAIRHQLAQIAWDGSQKLPVRLLATLVEALAAGRPIERLSAPVAAWMLFAASCARGPEPLVDPLAVRIATIAESPTDQQPDRFLALDAVFPPSLVADARFRRAVMAAHQALAQGRMADVLAL
ncbi:MAG TPA: mannitol dehydrogenase family protein [Caulobacteraceae bacterium]